MSSTEQKKGALSRKDYVLSITIIGALFFIFGFVTWLNGTLIPFLGTACELNEFQSYFVTFAFYIAYFVMAIPSSWVIQKTGYKNGMALGLFIMAIGALIFLPAANVRTFGVFLVGLFIQGIGLAILQTASNPYIVVIGPRESAAARISIMGICNKVAGFLAPLILAAVVMGGGMDEFKDEALEKLSEAAKIVALDELSTRLVFPYIIMAIALVIMAVLIKIAPLPEINDEDLGGEEEATKDESILEQIKGVIKYPQLMLGVLTIFIYVGVEVIAADSIGNYGKKLGFEFYGSLTSYTMTAMIIGYILGILLIPKVIKQEMALRISALLGGVITLLVIFIPADSFVLYNSILDITPMPPINDTILMLALCGLANALMWPAIWPMALADLGRFTKIGAALLIMAVAGGALIPLLYGALADSFGNQSAYWIMIPLYLWIFYYSVKGHLFRSWSKNR